MKYSLLRTTLGVLNRIRCGSASYVVNPKSTRFSSLKVIICTALARCNVLAKSTRMVAPLIVQVRGLLGRPPFSGNAPGTRTFSRATGAPHSVYLALSI